MFYLAFLEPRETHESWLDCLCWRLFIWKITVLCMPRIDDETLKFRAHHTYRDSIADSQPIEHCSARSHANHICLQFSVAVSLVCFLSWKISCKHKSNSIKWKSTQPFAVELRTQNLLCKCRSEKKTRSRNRLINLTLDCIEWASLLIFSSIHIVIRLLMFICILWKKRATSIWSR